MLFLLFLYKITVFRSVFLYFKLSMHANSYVRFTIFINLGKLIVYEITFLY